MLNSYYLRTIPLGFDDIFRLFETQKKETPNSYQTSYPPYNIIRNENNYIIEMSISGFDESEININVKQVDQSTQNLTIKGNRQADDMKTQYLHKGIAARQFAKEFTLTSNIEVRKAALEKGILRIYLEDISPPLRKEKTIIINEPSSIDNEHQHIEPKVFLTE